MHPFTKLIYTLWAVTLGAAAMRLTYAILNHENPVPFALMSLVALLLLLSINTNENEHR